MRHPLLLIVIGCLCLMLIRPEVSAADPDDLGVIIEGFVARHFPEATSHLWIVNDTQWDGDEMIVDLHTIVMEKQQPAAIENRYLLLIVQGKLAAVQRVPFDKEADCKPEEA